MLRKGTLSFLMVLLLTGGLYAETKAAYEPELLTTRTDENVLFYLPNSDIPGVTAMKTDQVPPAIMRSQTGEKFRIVAFNTITLNEAITENETVLAYMVISYSLGEKGLKKINKLIRNGAVRLESILSALTESDFTINTDGSSAPPDPKKFETLRNVFVYNFTVEDPSGKQYPMQIFVEFFVDSAELQ